MNFKMLKLGTECKDRATGLVGTLTHAIINMGKQVEYVFQPKGLNEEQQPLKKLALCIERLEVSEENFEEVNVPFEILGSEVTDKASGFSGMATQFIRHINGCFHVEIQPAGMLPNKNEPIRSNEFDIRGCTGLMISQLSKEERTTSIERNPSPDSHPVRRSYNGESISRSRTAR
jgi:hypothetical protein